MADLELARKRQWEQLYAGTLHGRALDPGVQILMGPDAAGLQGSRVEAFKAVNTGSTAIVAGVDLGIGTAEPEERHIA
ncbi:MAG: hypothetical protein AB8B83_08750 [Bdellovibrionales bacterium]